jgi:hypothetical protein
VEHIQEELKDTVITRRYAGLGHSHHFLAYIDSEGDASCNRTDQIIRAQVQKQSAETLKFLNLSPYNPGSQSKPRRISNQPFFNQDRIIQHTHHTLHFTSRAEVRLQHTESQIIINLVHKVAEA